MPTLKPTTPSPSAALRQSNQDYSIETSLLEETFPFRPDACLRHGAEGNCAEQAEDRHFSLLEGTHLCLHMRTLPSPRHPV
jgi:hypothetical protein